MLVGLGDLGAAVLLPGFINAHSHLEYTSFRGMLDDAQFGDWIIALIWGAGFFFVFPLILRLRTKKSKRTLSIQPDKLSTQIGKMSGDVPWAKMDSLYVTDEHVFLIRKNMNGFAIPRRAFVDEAQRDEFIRLCERYMQSAKA